MRFEETELKPYAEPVLSASLKVGSVYFSLNYVDDDMLIPEIRPIIFLGSNLDDGDSGQVYFQDADSYSEGVTHDSGTNDQSAEFWSGSEKETSHIFEYDSALHELMRCALRRKQATPMGG